MSKSSERFLKEWNLFKKQHHYTSDEQLIEQLKSQKYYYREKISRFKHGKIKLSDDDLLIFSKLFNVRQDYLSGKDDYRTEDDFSIAQQNKKGIFTGLHQVLVALGYADTYMEDDDYNPTFPQNTYAFLETLKKPLGENNISLICDVNADSYVSVPIEYYEQLLTDIVDYMTFKLDKLFSEATPIPTAVMEDGSRLLHPSTTIRATDGSSVTYNMKYIPNAEYDSDSVLYAFSVTEHAPHEE